MLAYILTGDINIDLAVQKEFAGTDIKLEAFDTPQQLEQAIKLNLPDALLIDPDKANEIIHKNKFKIPFIMALIDEYEINESVCDLYKSGCTDIKVKRQIRQIFRSVDAALHCVGKITRA